MYFHPANLWVLLFVAIVAAAWHFAASRNPELKQNLLSYGVVFALVGGVLIRSFASQFWAEIPLLAALTISLVWYLRNRLKADTVRAVATAVVGALVGFFIRDANIWLALVVASVAVGIALTGKIKVPPQQEVARR